jgi:hypothetical protein
MYKSCTTPLDSHCGAKFKKLLQEKQNLYERDEGDMHAETQNQKTPNCEIDGLNAREIYGLMRIRPVIVKRQDEGVRLRILRKQARVEGHAVREVNALRGYSSGGIECHYRSYHHRERMRQ